MNGGLPQDVLIEMMDYLSIPDLLQFLSTNSELKRRLYPYFAKKIDIHHEYLKYLNTIVRQKTQNKLEYLYNMVEKNSQLILVDRILSDFMGLNHMYEYDSRKIYSEYLLRLWVANYVINLTGNFDLLNIQFPVTNEIAKLIHDTIGLNIGFNISYIAIIDFIYANLIEPVDFLPESNMHDINKDYIFQSLGEESIELLAIMRLLYEKGRKGNVYPAYLPELLPLNESIF